MRMQARRDVVEYGFPPAGVASVRRYVLTRMRAGSVPEWSLPFALRSKWYARYAIARGINNQLHTVNALGLAAITAGLKFCARSIEDDIRPAPKAPLAWPVDCRGQQTPKVSDGITLPERRREKRSPRPQQ